MAIFTGAMIAGALGIAEGFIATSVAYVLSPAVGISFSQFDPNDLVRK